MIYQLPNGKSIDIPTERYLDMTDEELDALIASNSGEVMDDPWIGSVLDYPPIDDIEDDYVYDTLKEIPDISPMEKIDDLDTDLSDE